MNRTPSTETKPKRIAPDFTAPQHAAIRKAAFDLGVSPTEYVREAALRRLRTSEPKPKAKGRPAAK